jgi:hypothetical protein
MGLSKNEKIDYVISKLKSFGLAGDELESLPNTRINWLYENIDDQLEVWAEKWNKIYKDGSFKVNRDNGKLEFEVSDNLDHKL